jgi:hypothetical protein
MAKGGGAFQNSWGGGGAAALPRTRGGWLASNRRIFPQRKIRIQQARNPKTRNRNGHSTSSQADHGRKGKSKGHDIHGKVTNFKAGEGKSNRAGYEGNNQNNSTFKLGSYDVAPPKQMGYYSRKAHQSSSEWAVAQVKGLSFGSPQNYF